MLWQGRQFLTFHMKNTTLSWIYQPRTSPQLFTIPEPEYIPDH